MESYIDLAAALMAALALGVSFLAWRASMLAVRATTFDRRFEIYKDAESFIAAWTRDSSPDMSRLSVLVGAWSRSQFLCSDEVTSYLKQVWDDAVSAAVLRKVMSGELPGDHGQAAEESHALLREHADFVLLRATFMPDLRVRPGSMGRTILRLLQGSR